MDNCVLRLLPYQSLVRSFADSLPNQATDLKYSVFHN